MSLDARETGGTVVEVCRVWVWLPAGESKIHRSQQSESKYANTSGDSGQCRWLVGRTPWITVKLQRLGHRRGVLSNLKKCTRKRLACS